MESYLTLYNLINIFCILFALVFMVFSNKGLNSIIQKRVFNIALLTLVLLFASDTLWYSMDQSLIPQNIVISHILKGLYFISGCLCGFLWFIYFEVTLDTKFSKNKWFLLYTSSLVVLGIILVIVNAFTGILFKLDEVDGKLVYSRGALFPMLYVIIYAYIVTSSVRCLYYGFHNEVNKKRYFILATFPVIPFICGII